MSTASKTPLASKKRPFTATESINIHGSANGNGLIKAHTTSNTKAAKFPPKKFPRANSNSKTRSNKVTPMNPSNTRSSSSSLSSTSSYSASASTSSALSSSPSVGHKLSGNKEPFKAKRRLANNSKTPQAKRFKNADSASSSSPSSSSSSSSLSSAVQNKKDQKKVRQARRLKNAGRAAGLVTLSSKFFTKPLTNLTGEQRSKAIDDIINGLSKRPDALLTDEKSHKAEIPAATKLSDRAKLVKTDDSVSQVAKEILQSASSKLLISRVIQVIIKYGNAEQRERLFYGFYASSMYTLCQNPYGHYIVLKFVQYGSAKIVQEIVEELTPHAANLAKHQVGAKVVDSLLTTIQSHERIRTQQRRKLFFAVLQQLYGPAFNAMKTSHISEKYLCEVFQQLDGPTQKATIEHLEQFLDKCLNKDLIEYRFVHRIFYDYLLIQTSSRKFLGMLFQLLPFLSALANSRDGVALALMLISYSSNKDKKQIVKQMREDATFSAFLKDKHKAHTFLVFCRLFQCIDDTVLVRKNLLTALLDAVKADPALLKDSTVVKTFLWMFAPASTSYFPPSELHMLEQSFSPQQFSADTESEEETAKSKEKESTKRNEPEQKEGKDGEEGAKRTLNLTLFKKDLQAKKRELVAYVVLPLLSNLSLQSVDLLLDKFGGKLIYEVFALCDEIVFGKTANSTTSTNSSAAGYDKALKEQLHEQYLESLEDLANKIWSRSVSDNMQVEEAKSNDKAEKEEDEEAEDEDLENDKVVEENVKVNSSSTQPSTPVSADQLFDNSTFNFHLKHLLSSLSPDSSLQLSRGLLKSFFRTYATLSALPSTLFNAFFIQNRSAFLFALICAKAQTSEENKSFIAFFPKTALKQLQESKKPGSALLLKALKGEAIEQAVKREKKQKQANSKQSRAHNGSTMQVQTKDKAKHAEEEAEAEAETLE